MMSVLTQIGLASDLIAFVAGVGGGIVLILAAVIKGATKKSAFSIGLAAT